MKFPSRIVTPTLPHRLSRTMGEELIQVLRTQHDVNAWAFIMEDHLLEKLGATGFKNDSVAAKEDLKKQLPADVREALFPTERPLTRDMIKKPALSGSWKDALLFEDTKKDDDPKGGMGGGMTIEISPGRSITLPEDSDLVKKARQKVAASHAQKAASRPHIPLNFPAQTPAPYRQTPRQGGGMSL